ncbi:MAG: HAD-IIA family hydrolase [Desulfomonile tiedjei]|nr:HAD-IIA family hydrolase [Desulfomonile tiedjei]
MKCKYQAILADLDGTVNRGRTLIPGADEAYKILSGMGIRWMFLSNNATSMASDLALKITNLGLPVQPEQVVTSASALIYVLSQGRRDARIMVVGEPRLIAGIVEAGITVVEEPSEVDIVVVARDSGFNFEKLRKAHIALQNGARLWATNMDVTFPVTGGLEPGAGAIVAAVAAVAGRPPDRVFGKPSADIAELALKRLDLPKSACLLVGDRMETDILFAKNAGIASALVLTGVTSRGDLQKYSFSPDYVLDSIADVVTLFN